MYKFQSKQTSIFDFGMPLGMELDPKNRWVKKSLIFPWDELEQRYSSLFANKTTGNVAKPLRLALGALLIQKEYGYSDEEIVEQIRENPYLQYFCGMPSYTTDKPFDSSSMTHFRKRLTDDIIREINEMVIVYVKKHRKPKKSNKTKRHDPPSDDTNNNSGVHTLSSEEATLPEPKPEGVLLLDATVAPQNVRFPLDLSLLNESRLNLEGMIDDLHEVSDGLKPRTERKNAKRAYLAIAKKKKNKKKAIRKAIKQQLRYVRRDINIINSYFANGKVLPDKLMQRFETIKTVYEQQQFMYKNKTHSVKHRIISLSQPHIRPIVRGKAGADVEFGPKLHLSVSSGFTRVEYVSFEAFHEGEQLQSLVENYRVREKHYPKLILADKIYRNRENIAFCKDRGIELAGKPLGRPPKNNQFNLKRMRKHEIARIEVERKIGLCKGSYGLGKLRTKLVSTSRTSIALSVLAMNIGYILCCLYFWLLSLTKDIALELKNMLMNVDNQYCCRKMILIQ